MDLRSIRPLDRQAVLRSVKKTNRIVVVEEGWPFAGVGAHFIDALGPAGVAAGVDGIFMEVHENPARALSDGQQSLTLDAYRALAADLADLAAWRAGRG